MIMIQVHGYAAQKENAELTPFQFERREPGPHDVHIEILYSGICHSDLHQVKGNWGAKIFPMVPGHEIIGRVIAVGVRVKKVKPGDYAGVDCMVDSCRHCSACSKDLEQYCEEGATWTYNAIERDGVTPTYGGYSDQMVVEERFVVKVPETLDLKGAAPLLCAGRRIVGNVAGTDQHMISPAVQLLTSSQTVKIPTNATRLIVTLRRGWRSARRSTTGEF